METRIRIPRWNAYTVRNVARIPYKTESKHDIILSFYIHILNVMLPVTHRLYRFQTAASFIHKGLIYI